MEKHAAPVCIFAADLLSSRDERLHLLELGTDLARERCDLAALLRHVEQQRHSVLAGAARSTGAVNVESVIVGELKKRKNTKAKTKRRQE